MTILSEQAIRNIRSRRDLVGKLNRFCHEMESELEIESFVCKIIGNRWSYVAGQEDSYLPQRKIELTSQWGLVIDDRGIDEEEISEIKNFLEKIINDESKK